MKRHPQFFFYPEDGTSMCILSTKTKTFVGTATCREEDKDMMSEKTGCEIAYHRAIIRSLEDHLNELKLELSGLNKYLYSVNQSKYFDNNSYMARMLYSQITQREDDIDITKQLIRQEKQALIQYMGDKAEFYKKIRRNRQANSK